MEGDADQTRPETQATVMLSELKNITHGYNIQAVTDVVIWNPTWTEPETHQIIGRAWRGGQTRPVRVFHYINTGHPLELLLHNRNDKQAVVLDISLNMTKGDAKAAKEELRRHGKHELLVELDS